ncbi:unnamed protein product [Toxocara canis]|uniref:Uncharacterized protein n=1 Tax=Toxocara canis TaxID=6265 RepID=A0A183UNS5_TOXCA|nr:unnamed protein product [Toxocara canis]
MGDYSLARARSAIVLRSRSLERPSTLLITRARSVPDLTRYVSSNYKYKPHWPYRFYRDLDLYDDYWYDRYYYLSPLYKSTFFPRRYYYSDYLPYYWSWPYHYWSRYRGYWYDYDYPTYYYRRYYDPSYYSYFRSLYMPYRSSAFDTWYTSLNRGLSMYRLGLFPYSTFDRYWLTPSYWDRRFKKYWYY